MEIAPGVIRFGGIRGANSYGCLTGEGIAVIDTGLPGSGKRILGQIRDLGIDPGQVRQIILTHSDIDHAGSAAELRLTTGRRSRCTGRMPAVWRNKARKRG